MSGIYLHIPFCKKACFYCDFHFSTLLKYKKPLIEALINELKLKSLPPNQTKSIQSIYFGGGTPSVLSKDELDLILHTIQNNFSIDKNAEITFECNPDDITTELLSHLKQAGVNRLSIGCQSFNDEILSFLNRNHSAEQSKSAIKKALEAGFKNLTVDLIYGIPGQTEQSLKEDLEFLTSLPINHISAYTLTIEEETVFGKRLKKGTLIPLKDEKVVGHFNLVKDSLKEAGFEQYEISNFARNEHYAKHNSAYWFNNHYIGIGPSAHSYNGTERAYNISNNAKYISSLEKNIIPEEREILSQDEKINEYILTRLRTKWGIDTNHLQEQLNHKIPFQKINHYQKQEMLIAEGSIIKLTDKGKLFADEIAMDFFV